MADFLSTDELELPSHEVIQPLYECLTNLLKNAFLADFVFFMTDYITELKNAFDETQISPSTELIILAHELKAYMLLEYAFDISRSEEISKDMLAVFSYGKKLKESCNIHYLSCTADFLRMGIFIKIQIQDGFSKVFEEYLSFIFPKMQIADETAIAGEIYFWQDLESQFGHSLERREQLHEWLFTHPKLIHDQLLRNISMHYRLLNAEIAQMFKSS